MKKTLKIQTRTKLTTETQENIKPPKQNPKKNKTKNNTSNTNK